jgi:hypothetical protein
MMTTNNRPMDEDTLEMRLARWSAGESIAALRDAGCVIVFHPETDSYELIADLPERRGPVH